MRRRRLTDPTHAPKVGFLLRIRSRSYSSTLDLDALNASHEKGLATEKHFVVVAALVEAAREAHKAIEVELALKGGDFGECKVACEQVLEEIGAMHDKASTVWLP